MNNMERCSHPVLHNFSNTKPKTKCKWCGKTIKQVMKDFSKDYSSKLNSVIISAYTTGCSQRKFLDFNKQMLKTELERANLENNLLKKLIGRGQK